MIKRTIGILVVSAALCGADDSFRFPVFRKKLPRDERGTIEIDSTGVHYRSEKSKTTIRVGFAHIHEADLSDPRVIRIETYDILKRRLNGRRVYVFRLSEGKHGEALTRFLVERTSRPVIGAYDLSSDAKDAEVLAYHRHRLGGCHGKLRIEPGGIRFVSEQPAESRTWRFQDIETIGSMNPFHFRVSTLAETYNLDLKDRLPLQAHENAWRRIYSLLP